MTDSEKTKQIYAYENMPEVTVDEIENALSAGSTCKCLLTINKNEEATELTEHTTLQDIRKLHDAGNWFVIDLEKLYATN